MNAKDNLLQLFINGDADGKTFPELLKQLSIPYRERGRLERLLNDLLDEEKIFQTSRNSSKTF
jgi:hypothetical protein